MNREDIRTRVRDLTYEDTADLFSDARINRAISDQLRDLPHKQIYNEEVVRTPVQVNALDYTLPDNTHKLDKLELVWGTDPNETFEEIKGWDEYAGAVWLPYRIRSTGTLRMHVRKTFTDLTDDVTATDVPDDKIHLLSVGVALDLYTQLMGYFIHTENWDTIAKPDGTDMSKIARWINQLEQQYKDLLKAHRKSPRPRDIDLTS